MSDQFLMKGKTFSEKALKKLTDEHGWPVYVEAKYDEIRLHVKRVGDGVQFLSYAGKPLHNLQRFHDELLWLMGNFQFTNLDLGVEVNGNFNDTYRYVRSSKGIPEDLKSAPIKLFIFDTPDCPESTYVQRTHEITRLVYDASKVDLPLHSVEYSVCSGIAGIKLAYNSLRERGFEGAMIKSRQHKYVSGSGHRSSYWLKMKPSETFDGQIVGFNEAYSLEGEPLARTGSFLVRLEDGSMAQPAGIPHELGAQIHRDPNGYVNRWIEFKCMERDRAGGYRHPSFVRFREDKV